MNILKKYGFQFLDFTVIYHHAKKKQKKNRKKLTSGYREKLLTDRLTDR